MEKCPKCNKYLDKVYSTDVHAITNLLAYDNGEYNIYTEDVDGEYESNTLVECGHCGCDITHLMLEGLPETVDICD